VRYIFKIYGIDGESKQGNDIFPSKRCGVWETAMKVCYMTWTCIPCVVHASP